MQRVNWCTVALNTINNGLCMKLCSSWISLPSSPLCLCFISQKANINCASSLMYAGKRIYTCRVPSNDTRSTVQWYLITKDRRTYSLGRCNGMKDLSCHCGSGTNITIVRWYSWSVAAFKNYDRMVGSTLVCSVSSSGKRTSDRCVVSQCEYLSIQIGLYSCCTTLAVRCFSHRCSVRSSGKQTLDCCVVSQCISTCLFRLNNYILVVQYLQFVAFESVFAYPNVVLSQAPESRLRTAVLWASVSACLFRSGILVVLYLMFVAASLLCICGCLSDHCSITNSGKQTLDRLILCVTKGP